VATVRPAAGAAYQTFTTAPFTVAAGAHEIRFTGLDTSSFHSALIDDVSIRPIAQATSQRRTVYDGYKPILDFDGAGTLKARYLQMGPDVVDEVLARETAAGVAWYLPDRLGTIRDLVDNSGAVIDHVDYNAFGKASGETAPAVGDRLMGFAGMERSRATGLNLAVHRAQDPAAGRWLSEDPIGFAAGDANLYRYVGNSAANAIDPSGLDGMSVGHVAAAGAKGLGQGVLNTVNGVQDVGIGVLNTPAFAWNWTAGWVLPECPYIPSPDWSRGKLTYEDPILHDASKFLGGSGVTVLAPFVPKLFRSNSCPVPAASPVTLIGKGDPLAAAVGWLKPTKGVIDVVVHGTPDKFVVLHNGKFVDVTHRTLATLIRKRGQSGESIRLISCSSGGSPAGVAQNLANKLGMRVTAPTNKVWIHSNGILTIGAKPGVNTGQWLNFLPKGPFYR